MKKTTIMLLVVLVGITAIAQPNYSVKPYSVSAGRKANQYNKEAKRFLKNGRLNEALMNAAMALKIAVKKGQISTAQGYLNQNYDNTITANLNRIEILDENTESFEGDQTVTDLAEILRLYKTMRNLTNIIKEIPPKNLKPAKRKDPGFRPDLKDYRPQITTYKEKLAKAKESAAKMHYAEGRKLESQGGKLNARMAAKRYRWAYEYVPDYRDAVQRYEEVHKLGTTRLGIVKFESSGSQYGDVGAIVSDQLLTFLANKASELEFFEVIDRNQLDIVMKEQQLALSGFMDESTTADIGELKGVDVLLVGNVTRSFIDRQKSGPEEKSYSKEVVIRKEKYIDDEGKERTRKIKGTVYAKAKVYTKKAEAVVSCSFKLLDVQTGTLLNSGSATGNDSWSKRWIGSYTGDKRALPDFMRKNEPDYPGYDRMITVSSNKAANQIYSALLSYAEKVGR